MSGIHIQSSEDYEKKFEPYYRETEAVRVFQLGGMETVVFHMQKGITGTFQAVPGQDEAEVYYLRRGCMRLMPLDEPPYIVKEGDFFALSQREAGILFYVMDDMELLCVSGTHNYLGNIYTTNHVDTLLRELQERDGNSRSHGERVRRLVMRMVTHMKNFDGRELEILLQASRMHDVGKIRIPLNILLKEGPLTPEERLEINKHVVHSADIVEELFDGRMSTILLHQHENYDGTGYPDHLCGKDIPSCARIIAVADAYDAMVVTQPYHKGIPQAKAIAELKRCAGTQFDPDCVQALVEALEDPNFENESDTILKKTETAVGVQLKEKAKRDFLSNMSHDMRTPMNAIINLTALAKEDARSETDHAKLLEDLEKIDLSSQFLLGLVNDILDMSRIDSGKMQFHPSVVYAEDVYGYIDSVIRPLCTEKDITLDMATPLFGTPVYVDKVRFEQIFFNLLSNAVKYSGDGTEISLRTENIRKVNGELQIDFVFTDHGIGMSEEFQGRMFTPFEREDAADARMGTGLGLAITKRIVSQMGGSIRVQSAVGAGTTITVHLDLAIPDKELQMETDILRRRTEKAASYYDIKDAHILVAEDHPLNREIVERLLKKVGAQSTLAENGRKALDLFAASAPGDFDAILMDVRMPVMDGIAATKAIRSLQRGDAKTVPIVAMTAEAFEQNRKETLEAGMDAHLSKPIKPEELFRTLAVEISLRK